jgi:hypothetical protein
MARKKPSQGHRFGAKKGPERRLLQRIFTPENSV